MVLLIIIIVVYAFVTGMLWKWVDNKEQKEGDSDFWAIVAFWPFLIICSPILLIVYAGYWMVGKFQKEKP